MTSFEIPLQYLERAMRTKVPDAKLVIQQLPLVAEIKLALIDSAYPQAELTQTDVELLMDQPPYWAFCWASGQVMARYLLDHRQEVYGKTVVDFGSGSGVVAIAAAIAGASHSIALDSDKNALEATKLNARLNQVTVDICDDLEALKLDKSNALLIISDVFYERENIPLLKGFINDYQDLIIADSRVKPNELIGMHETARHQSCTVPDLAEASSFNSVGIYRRC